MPRDIGRRSDDGSVILTSESASTRSSTSSTSALLSGSATLQVVLGIPALTARLALVLSPIGKPLLGLVLGIAGSPALSPALSPGCLLLPVPVGSVAAFALVIAVFSALTLAFAITVLTSLGFPSPTSQVAVRSIRDCDMLA
jgi:hypothetical protein